MILSVSRRTDIPAFYLDWFFNRIKEGFVLVRNPMNYHQVSKVILSPDVIDCIVFWTKDPRKIINRLDELKGYKYYFHITITPYDNKIERSIRNKEEIIESLKKLSEKIGKEKVIWRYDPIILSTDITIEDHIKNFESLASRLSNHTNVCTISFLDIYKKTERNMKTFNSIDMNDEIMLEIGGKFAKIAEHYNLKINTCSEKIDLSSVGIDHAKCIDDNLISETIGCTLNIGKDKNQRDICGCVTSIDIGAYNTCKHQCLYCYANFSDTAVKNNIMKHDKNSPFLIGHEMEGDKITNRKMESYKRAYEQSTFL